ncbi:hypothetical protein K439DRAFT_1618509 [Ramaria rubella]|nr:hypothetical protein K439DRAFT_1618509 [Ramaria rubella]
MSDRQPCYCRPSCTKVLGQRQHYRHRQALLGSSDDQPGPDFGELEHGTSSVAEDLDQEIEIYNHGHDNFNNMDVDPANSDQENTRPDYWSDTQDDLAADSDSSDREDPSHGQLEDLSGSEDEGDLLDDELTPDDLAHVLEECGPDADYWMAFQYFDMWVFRTLRSDGSGTITYEQMNLEMQIWDLGAYLSISSGIWNILCSVTKQASDYLVQRLASFTLDLSAQSH